MDNDEKRSDTLAKPMVIHDDDGHYVVTPAHLVHITHIADRQMASDTCPICRGKSLSKGS
jgi:hypothetical protein